MIHTDLSKLKPALFSRATDALEEMRSDETLRMLGVTGIAVSETLREVAVQMAYRSRLLYTELQLTIGSAKLNEFKSIISKYVQDMYKAAGLYAITASDALKPNTWTLDSNHLRGEAIDLVPLKSGAYWWAAPDAVWKRMGEIGEAHGLEWGGRWKHTDCPHFELKKGKI